MGRGCGDPAFHRDGADHDARPFDRFQEDGFLHAALSKHSEDGLGCFCDLIIVGVVGEVDHEVACRGPFRGVGPDAELGASSVDLAGDCLDIELLAREDLIWAVVLEDPFLTDAGFVL